MAQIRARLVPNWAAPPATALRCHPWHHAAASTASARIRHASPSSSVYAPGDPTSTAANRFSLRRTTSQIGKEGTTATALALPSGPSSSAAKEEWRRRVGHRELGFAPVDAREGRPGAEPTEGNLIIGRLESRTTGIRSDC
jgi:hypothetical protein